MPGILEYIGGRIIPRDAVQLHLANPVVFAQRAASAAPNLSAHIVQGEADNDFEDG